MTDDLRTAAVVLVGGRGSRMGGVVKPRLLLGGRSLFVRTVGALAGAGVAPLVAVGPRIEDDERVAWTREEPPHGGPVAGIAAALPALDAPWAFVLAGDLVHPAALVARLSAARAEAAEAGALADAEGFVFTAGGHPQWLAGLYRTAAMERARAALGTVQSVAARELFEGLAITWLPDEDGLCDDIDTPADLARAREQQQKEDTP
ncbi:molybdenum cofactor guanylyltransferase [Microbacterium sp. p3-SID336]|uniref:molybdenum cofactor guanylyltransferase n=1 Tax=Microbacterium sp. p3-SID336 TaxID=2916212 RepID=UPI0021A67D51|nr:NTP transferase domain-containing protein [Microbacterium sp. p3-SID336]MCT1478327.1 NTP transferase domain-containing protein [Microbacterium sp. p3-SID336]